MVTSKFETIEGMIAKQNGYPTDFRIVNVIADSMDGKYFPATISHIIAIRNMTDAELERNVAEYYAALADRHNRVRPVVDMVNALIHVAEDEWHRRTEFKSGSLTLEDYWPDIYSGNVPKVVQ